MKKDELIKVICAAVLKEPNLTKAEMESSPKCGRTTLYKGGLYFLYDDQDEIIYIGKIGDTSETSLYDRVFGHTSGSHRVQDSRWYPFVKYGKFHRFSGLNDDELYIIERLAIAGMNHPIYNDRKDVTQAVVDAIALKI